MKLRPRGHWNWLRQFVPPYRLQLVSIIKIICLGPTELTQILPVESKFVCYLKAVLNFSRLNISDFLLPVEIFSKPSTSLKFSKHPISSHTTLFFYGPVSQPNVPPCQHSVKCLFYSLYFAEFYYRFLGFLGTIVLHYCLFPVASQIYLVCY